MATIKNVSDTYTINVPTMTVNGNFVVTGVSTSVDSTNTTIWDNIITLNGGTSPSTTPTQNAGIEVDRGNQANVALRWNEGYKQWQITNDGTAYGNIAVTSGTGGITISGNLDMGGYAIFSSTNANVTIDTNVAIKNTSVAPSAISNYNVVYSQTPGGGGSGLYVTNTTTAAQELATQAAAIKYSIIFG